MKRLILTWSALMLVAVVAAQAVGTFSGPFASVFVPLRVLLVLSALVGVPPTVCAAVAAVGLFCLNSGLFVGTSETPERNWYIYFVIAIVSLILYWSGLSSGQKYQGRDTVLACFALNIAFVVVIPILFWQAARAPSFGRALAAHTAFSLWLVTYAFPYLGEMP
jgi:hypothetical protein